MTVEAAHALYIETVISGQRKALKDRTIADKRAIWSRDMRPCLGEKQIGEVTADNLWDMVEAKAASAPVRANRLATEAKVFFSWCVSRGGQRAGIALGIDPSLSLSGKHYAEAKGRTRFLSDKEIGWFLAALAQETETRASASYRRAFLLMLLTGARISEVKEAPASEYIDGIWTIAAGRTKNGISHSIALGAWGRSLMITDSEWLIPHPNGGWIDSEIWYEVRDRLHRRMEAKAQRKLERWTPHDLRRTQRLSSYLEGQRLSGGQKPPSLHPIDANVDQAQRFYHRHDYVTDHDRRQPDIAWMTKVFA